MIRELCTNFALACRITSREFRFELNSKLANFRVFLTCLILGVSVITSVETVNHSLVSGIKENGRELLGGDLDIRLIHRAATVKQTTFMKKKTSRLSKIMKMRAMAEPIKGQKPRTLVELKSIDNLYPLIGKIALEPPSPLRSVLSIRDNIWGAAVDPNLLIRLGLRVGDKIRIGEKVFKIRATIISEPDQIASMFSFGPRVLISNQAMKLTGLIKPGSQIYYHYRALLPPNKNLKKFKKELLAKFPAAGWRIRSPESSARGLKQFINRMTSFFSFLGLSVMLIGGLGITGATRGYLNSKISTIAILKSIGGNNQLVFLTYLLKLLLVGGCGILLGSILGTVLPLGCLFFFQDLLPVKPVMNLFLEPLIVSGVFGFLSILVFSIWPIAIACHIKPGGLFRVAALSADNMPSWKYKALFHLCVLSLGGFCILTSREPLFAMFFVLGVLSMVFFYSGSASLILKWAQKIDPRSNLNLRIVLSNLRRDKTQFPNIVVSLGLGLTLLSSISLIEKNLIDQLYQRLPDQAPAFFFIDVQPNQIQEFDETISSIPQTSGFQSVPTLRGRIIKINGTNVEDAKIAPGSRWAIRGDRALTFGGGDSVPSKVVAGKWWPDNYSGPPLISLDSKLASDFNVSINDTLTINILGRNVVARIKNLRKINWRSLRFDFAIIFAPGVLEKAPLSYIAAIKAPKSAENSIIKATAKKFPNVSVISVRDALEASANLLSGVGVAIKASTFVALIMGIIVLSSILSSEHQRRMYDSVVFKVLGATRNKILIAYILEYGFSGTLTGILSSFIGTLISFLIITYYIKMAYVFSFGTIVGVLSLSILIVTISGLMTTWKTLGQPVNTVLRNE